MNAVKVLFGRIQYFLVLSAFPSYNHMQFATLTGKLPGSVFNTENPMIASRGAWPRKNFIKLPNRTNAHQFNLGASGKSLVELDPSLIKVDCTLSIRSLYPQASLAKILGEKPLS
jgi:hypothetical protein